MAKIGRNQPCPCGSGKKYKKCCINKPKSNSPTVQNRDELDLLMEKGWSLLQKNETANACDVWIELWNSLKNRFKPEFRDIKDANMLTESLQQLNGTILPWVYQRSRDKSQPSKQQIRILIQARAFRLFLSKVKDTQ